MMNLGALQNKHAAPKKNCPHLRAKNINYTFATPGPPFTPIDKEKNPRYYEGEETASCFYHCEKPFACCGQPYINATNSEEEIYDDNEGCYTQFGYEAADEKATENVENNEDLYANEKLLRLIEKEKPQKSKNTCPWLTPLCTINDTCQKDIMGHETYYDLLKSIKGKFVLADFLIGENHITTKAGVLYDVGMEYIVLEDTGRGTYEACDIYCLKFIRVFNPIIPN